MKKKVIALFCILFLMLFIPTFMYWRSFAASVVLSALNLRYGLSLKYDGFHFDLLPGKVTIAHPRLTDAFQRNRLPLATAERLDLSIYSRKVLRGKVDLKHIQLNRLSVDFSLYSQGGLNWTHVLNRLQPERQVGQPTTQLAQLGQTQSPSIQRLQTQVPQIQFPQSSDPQIISPLIALAEKSQGTALTPVPVESNGSQSISAASSSVESPKGKSATPGKSAGSAKRENAGKAATSSSVAPATESPQSATGTVVPPLKVPLIDVEDLILNYRDEQTSEIYILRMDHFTFDPKKYFMEMRNPFVSLVGGNKAALTMKNFIIENALAPRGTQLEFVADTVHLNGEKTGEDQYDFNQITRIWVKIYKEISEAVSSKKPPSDDPIFPIASIKGTQVSVSILPQKGTPESAGALAISANDVSYIYAKDELVLVGVTLVEAGKTLLRLDRIVLNGLVKQRVEVQHLELNGGRLDISENAAGGLNIIRAIQSIRDIIDSLVPKSTQTARAIPPLLETLKSVSMVDNTINWERPNGLNQQIALGQLDFDIAGRSLDATDFLMTRRDGNQRMLVSIPSIHASPSTNLNGKIWDSVILDKAAFDVNWKSDRFELVEAASDWVALPGIVSRGLKDSPIDAPYESFLIRDMQFNQATVRIADLSVDPPIQHRLNLLHVHWNDVLLGRDNAPMTPLIVEAVLVEPSAGSLAFQGQASPSGFPLNMSGSAALLISDITVMNPYLQASEKALPVRVVKGGLRTNAKATISNDQVDGIIDLYLYNPEFAPNKSYWPLKIDQKTVINSLNQMKDKNGVIAFPNNVWTGYIRDPKFTRGLGLNDLFWTNVQGALTTVLKLPLDIVGSVRDVFKMIIGQE